METHSGQERKNFHPEKSRLSPLGEFSPSREGVATLLDSTTPQGQVNTHTLRNSPQKQVKGDVYPPKVTTFVGGNTHTARALFSV